MIYPAEKISWAEPWIVCVRGGQVECYGQIKIKNQPSLLSLQCGHGTKMRTVAIPEEHKYSKE